MVYFSLFQMTGKAVKLRAWSVMSICQLCLFSLTNVVSLLIFGIMHCHLIVLLVTYQVQGGITTSVANHLGSFKPFFKLIFNLSIADFLLSVLVMIQIILPFRIFFANHDPRYNSSSSILLFLDFNLDPSSFIGLTGHDL